jgi:trigger factor
VNPKALRELTITVTEEEIRANLDKISQVYRRKKQKFKDSAQEKPLWSSVKRVYEKEILLDAQDEAIKSKIYNEIKARKEEVVSEIYIKDRKDEENGITVTVEYEAVPTFLFPNLGSIKVQKKIKRVSEIDVEDEIEKYQRKLGKLVPVDRESKEGDYLIVDYKELENGKTTKTRPNLTLQISKETINPEILERFLNKKKGDTVEIDFVDEEKNRPVKLVYVIKEVAELQLPELNDEFAKNLGFENLEKMKEEIRNYLIKQNEKASEDELEWQIIEEIYNRVQFELPRSMVEEKITRIAQSFKIRS